MPVRGGCDDGCGALDDYQITYDPHDGVWTVHAREEHGVTVQGGPDSWIVFASSGVHVMHADDMLSVVKAFAALHPDDFMHVVVNDGYPLSETTAELETSELLAQRRRRHEPGRHRARARGSLARYASTRLPVRGRRVNRPARRVVLSYGMGADSTALLLRLIHEPDIRPCGLADLLVIRRNQHGPRGSRVPVA